MVEIKDKDILDVFKIGEKNPKDIILHGVIRQQGKTVIVYERNGGEQYSGFQERLIFDPSKLSGKQVQFLREKGYDL